MYSILCIVLGVYTFITLELSTTFKCIIEKVADAIIIMFSISLICHVHSIKECEQIFKQEILDLQNVRQ